HGLTYRNVAKLAAVEGFSEFNIGHSIVSRAMFVGMRAAVAEMVRLLKENEPSQ
ncbi:MAG: pyridoxine 5'-phosphate synthase, partial [Phycisphaerales bacterium]|nr:pyridoxine 5'-phosphate synthase [Phycisphaerales bacterium]